MACRAFTSSMLEDASAQFVESPTPRQRLTAGRAASAPELGLHVGALRIPRTRKAEVAQLEARRKFVVQQCVVQLQIPEWRREVRTSGW